MADEAVGEVEIILAGSTEILRCSLAAAKAVNAFAGGNGHQGIIARLGMLDFDTYVAVIAYGLGKRPVDVEEKVYRTGVMNLTAVCIKYVTNLANGGKPVKEAEGDDKAGEA